MKKSTEVLKIFGLIDNMILSLNIDNLKKVCLKGT